MDIVADGFASRQAMLIREYELILKYKKQGGYNINTNVPVFAETRGKQDWRDYAVPLDRSSIPEIGKIKKQKEVIRRKRKIGVQKYGHIYLDQLLEKKKEREASKKKV